MRWQQKAACRDEPTELFFVPPRLDGVRTREHEQALRICASCPVTKQCKSAGRGNEGTWGGEYRPYKTRNGRDELEGLTEAFELLIELSAFEFEEVNG